MERILYCISGYHLGKKVRVRYVTEGVSKEESEELMDEKFTNKIFFSVHNITDNILHMFKETKRYKSKTRYDYRFYIEVAGKDKLVVKMFKINEKGKYDFVYRHKYFTKTTYQLLKKNEL